MRTAPSSSPPSPRYNAHDVATHDRRRRDRWLVVLTPRRAPVRAGAVRRDAHRWPVRRHPPHVRPAQQLQGPVPARLHQGAHGPDPEPAVRIRVRSRRRPCWSPERDARSPRSWAPFGVRPISVSVHRPAVPQSACRSSTTSSGTSRTRAWSPSASGRRARGPRAVAVDRPR